MITSASERISDSRSRSRAIEAATPPSVAIQRMAVARLAEASDQDVVASLEEEDLGRYAARLERVDSLSVGERRVAADRASSTSATTFELTRLTRNELRQVAQQLGRQVVDDAVANVLEQLARGRLAGAGQPADDRDVRASARFRRRHLVGHRVCRRHAQSPWHSSAKRGGWSTHTAGT